MFFFQLFVLSLSLVWTRDDDMFDLDQNPRHTTTTIVRYCLPFAIGEVAVREKQRPDIPAEDSPTEL